VDLSIPINEASSNLFEFKISGNIGVDEDLGEFSRCNDEFRDKINGIVTVTAKVSRWGLVWSELAIKLC